ncbi:MAG: 50S ribosomal protein L23 [Desulfovibrionaceae bacterium]|nr:50S ribosomal protein L23 [Desulfovibrionaceae bacterium]
MELTAVLLKPLSTEKVSRLKKDHNRYGFKVHPNANKIEIKQAVEMQFDVKVVDVTVVRKRPRTITRQGRIAGQKAGYKKAYVTLSRADSIAGLEGV